MSTTLGAEASSGSDGAAQQLEELLAVMHATKGAVIMQPDGAASATYSAAARRLLGMDLPLGERPERWVFRDGTPCVLEDLPHARTCAMTATVDEHTAGLVWPDGRTRWLSFESARWSGVQGRHGGGVVTTFTDVTPAVEAARELTRTRDQLSRVLRGAKEGFWEWDVVTGRVEYSTRWAEMLGRPVDDLVHDLTLYETLAHPEDRGRNKHVMEAYLRGELGIAEVEERWKHADGHWVWLLYRSSVTERDAAGKPLRLAGTVIDVSRRKLAELALQQALAEKDDLLAELTASLAKVKTLTALLPMCAWCRRLRSDEGYWSSLEQYLERHTDSRITHGICPSCAERLKHDTPADMT